MDEQTARSRAQQLADPRELELALRAERDRPIPQTYRLPRTPRPIGIYRPVTEEGKLCFRRPPVSRFGDHYAVRQVLQRKQSLLPLRIVFLGESVAAGYLYAPHLTPAVVLEGQLRDLAGDGQFEVVDLSRANETIGALVETLEASVQLSPDMFVIFAGNNWDLLETPEISSVAPSTLDRQAFGDALAHGGLLAVRQLASDRLADITRRAFARVADITRAIGVPVIVVLPEVNLADWETREPPVWLPRGDSDEWFVLLSQAQHALQLGQPDVVRAITQQMNALDSGLCATTHRLEAKAFASQGDEERAALAARREIDAARYPGLCALGAPRATADTYRLLLDAAASHHFHAVDLRRVFGEYAGTPFAGSRMFLDYCHLTREGMTIAMAAVAAAAFTSAGLGDMTWQSALARARAPGVCPEADAVAKLGAAIHNAHRLVALADERRTIGAWCRAALDASPHVAETMRSLGTARLSSCPVVLTRWQRSILESEAILGHAHGLSFDHVDGELLLAIDRALASRDRPSWTAPRLDRELELARVPFLWNPAERCYTDAMFEGASATVRSVWPEISFALVGSGTIELELTARLPGPDRQRRGAITVVVGDRLAGRFEAGAGWTRATFRVARVRGPIERIRVRFPPLGRCGDLALAEIKRRLVTGQPARLHPVFGEVFSLRARPCQGVPSA